MQTQWRWKLLIFALVAGIGGTWFGLWFHEKGAPDRARLVVSVWQDCSPDWKADEAAEAWRVRKEYLGSAYDLLTQEERELPYSILSEKYFDEGNYGRAFDMGLAVDEMRMPRIIGPWPWPFTIYTAALAGRKGWLEEMLAKEKHEDRRMLIRAALAWAEKRYADILTITDPWKPSERPASELPGDQAVPYWLAFFRGRALAELGSFKEALVVLDSGMGASVARMGGGTDFVVHAVVVMADIAERAGDIQSALALAETLAGKHSPLDRDISWADELKRNQERIQRLKARLGEETTPEVPLQNMP